MWTVTVIVRPDRAIDLVASSGDDAAAIVAVMVTDPAVVDVRCRLAVGESSSGCPSTLRDEVRSAAEDLFHGVEELHRRHGWPYVEFERRAFQATRRAQAELGRRADMALPEVLSVLGPVLNEWWPTGDLTAGVRVAIDRLRVAAATATYASDDCAA